MWLQPHALLAGWRAPAQTASEAAARIVLEPAVTNLNRLALSYRMGFNISANFKNVGGYRALTPSPTRNAPETTAMDITMTMVMFMTTTRSRPTLSTPASAR